MSYLFHGRYFTSLLIFRNTTPLIALPMRRRPRVITLLTFFARANPGMPLLTFFARWASSVLCRVDELCARRRYLMRHWQGHLSIALLLPMAPPIAPRRATHRPMMLPPPMVKMPSPQYRYSLERRYFYGAAFIKVHEFILRREFDMMRWYRIRRYLLELNTMPIIYYLARYFWWCIYRDIWYEMCAFDAE